MDMGCLRRDGLALAGLPWSPGVKKGDLSRYVEQAVNRSLFEDTVEAVQERNLHYDPDTVMWHVEEAVREVRRVLGA
jgi:hypothetical protein